MKKDEPNPELVTSPVKEVTEESKEDNANKVVENEYAVLIDAEKSFDEQIKIGRPLFFSLLNVGTVNTKTSDDNNEATEEISEAERSISETLATMISFQVKRKPKG